MMQDLSICIHHSLTVGDLILVHTHTHTPPPHTNTDELIQAIRQDITVASEKLEEPSMKELAVQLDDHLRTKHTD